MRRLLRTLQWTGLSLSTLLLAATVFYWVRSRGTMETWMFTRFTRDGRWNDSCVMAGNGQLDRYYVISLHQRLCLQRLSFGLMRPPDPDEPFEYHPRSDLPADVVDFVIDHHYFTVNSKIGASGNQGQFIGFAWNHASTGLNRDTGRPGIESRTIVIPYPCLAILFAFWPLLFITFRFLRRKRHAPHLCPICHYDLRATPDPTGPRLPRCPECGHQTPTPSSINPQSEIRDPQ